MMVRASSNGGARGWHTAKLALAAFGFACAAPAEAQQVPVEVAGAEGRFELALDPKTRVPGFAPASVAAFLSRVDRLVGTLRSMPSVNGPPAPNCHRLASWIALNPFHGVLDAEVSVMTPINFQNGKCHRMTSTGVFLTVNRLVALLDPQRAHVRDGDSGSPWWFVPAEKTAGRIIDLGDRVALTHGRAALLRPVSTERYLRLPATRQAMDPLASDAAIARLSAAEKMAPACIADATGYAETRPGCPSGRTLAELNPAYFDKGRPDAFQLLVIATPDGRTHGESDQRLEARRAIWRALDRNALLTLLE